MYIYNISYICIYTIFLIYVYIQWFLYMYIYYISYICIYIIGCYEPGRKNEHVTLRRRKWIKNQKDMNVSLKLEKWKMIPKLGQCGT